MNLRQRKKAFRKKGFGLMDMHHTMNVILIKTIRGETLSKKEKEVVK